MQNFASIFVFSLLCVLPVAGQRNLETLKIEADHAEGGHQAKLCAQVAQQLVSVVDQQFTQGNSEQAQATVREVLKYAQKARDAAVKSRDQMKQTEIRLRSTQRQLEGLKRTLALEDRPPLDDVEKKIEQFRQDLLDAMFSKRKEKT
jgi:hypothetical protein